MSYPGSRSGAQVVRLWNPSSPLMGPVIILQTGSRFHNLYLHGQPVSTAPASPLILSSIPTHKCLRGLPLSSLWAFAQALPSPGLLFHLSDLSIKVITPWKLSLFQVWTGIPSADAHTAGLSHPLPPTCHKQETRNITPTVFPALTSGQPRVSVQQTFVE